MTPMPVVHYLRAQSGRGSAAAPNLFVLTNVPQRPPLYILLESLNHDDALCAQVVPELTHIHLEPSDRLLLGTSSIARHVGELLIAQAIAQPDPSAALH